MLGSGAALSCTAAAQLGSQASHGTASTSSAPSSGALGSGAPGSGAFDALRSGIATHSDALRMYGTSDFGVSGGSPQQQQPRSAVGAWRGAGGGAGSANTYPMLSAGAADRLQTAQSW